MNPCSSTVAQKTYVMNRALLMRFCRRSVGKNDLRRYHRSLSTLSEPSAMEKVSEPTTKDFLENYVNPLRKPDFFGVHELVKVKELFDARVHLGHREDTLDIKMRPYIFGSRLGHLILDLEQTAPLFRDALNFAAHVAYRGGIILFVSRYYQHCPIVEQTAIDCQEYAHTRTWSHGLFTNSEVLLKTTIRLPDLIILLCTLNDVLDSHPAVWEAAKMNIPTIGIVDTNSDPTLITYPVPGNDDSLCAVELYCKLFKAAILKGKEVRKRETEIMKNAHT